MIRTINTKTVHDVIILTVVAGESYKDFVGNLQREICDSLSARPVKADATYFTGKLIIAAGGHTVEADNASVHSMVTYDLLGNIAENTRLTRKTVAEIMSGIQPAVFKQFKQNPEHFIRETQDRSTNRRRQSYH